MENWKGLTPHNETHNLFACSEPNCGYRLLLPIGHTTDHVCPRTGSMSISWEEILNKMEELWLEADRLMDDFMQDQQNLEKKGLMRGICIGIRPFMSVWYPKTDDVARELVARWKARQAGEVRETNGLGSLRTAAPVGWYPAEGGAFTSDPDHSIHAASAKRRASEPTLQEAANKSAAIAKRTKAAHGLSDTDAATIRRVRELGMMPLEELAKMYKTDVETVKSL